MKFGTIVILILSTFLSTVYGQKEINSLSSERIYVHTDRNVYMAGEYIFYKVYLDGNQDLLSKYAYLILRDQKNSIIKARVEIHNKISFGSIYLPDTLSSGIYQIVSYSNLMRNDTTEAYFKKEIVIANRFDDKMSFLTEIAKSAAPDRSTTENSDYIQTKDNLFIHLDKVVFDQREKISFSVGATNMPEKSLINLSVSISEFIPELPIEPSISDCFSYNFKSAYPGEFIQNQCRHMPEFAGVVLQGRILVNSHSAKEVASKNRNSTNPRNNYTVFVSTIDTVVNLQFTFTDSIGSFGFTLNPYFDGKDLFIRLNETVDASIETDDKFKLTKSFTPSKECNFRYLKEFLNRESKIVQIQKFYNKKVILDTQKVLLPVRTIPRVYYGNYSRILPSDYYELRDFAEISKEIVPALKVWKTRGKFVSAYTNLKYQSDSDAEPTIFLDGVPIDDVNQIINLGTNDIKRIESLPAIRYYGEISFHGILAVFSKNLEINNILFKTPAIRYQALPSQPYTKPEPFNHVKIKKHDPDFRQVLLWDPEIYINNSEKKQIECFASDLQGKYRINIQGITSSGDPVNCSAVITIQSK
jgi:hypothetical protein